MPASYLRVQSPSNGLQGLHDPPPTLPALTTTSLNFSFTSSSLTLLQPVLGCSSVQQNVLAAFALAVLFALNGLLRYLHGYSLV